MHCSFAKGLWSSFFKIGGEEWVLREQLENSYLLIFVGLGQ